MLNDIRKDLFTRISERGTLCISQVGAGDPGACSQGLSQTLFQVSWQDWESQQGIHVMIGAWPKRSCWCKATREAMIRFERWHALLWWISIHRRKDRFRSVPCPSRLKLASLDALDDQFCRIFAGRLECPVPKEKAAQAFTAMFAFETNSWHAFVIATGTERGVEMADSFRRPLVWGQRSVT